MTIQSATPKSSPIATADPLYLSDEEIRQRIGIGATNYRQMVRTLEPQGFPRREALFSNKRCWPAVRDFLLRRATGTGTMEQSTLDKEDWT